MPGRLFLTTPLHALGLGDAKAELERGKRLNIAPGQEVCTFDAEHGFSTMRWGIVPVGRVNARGRPVMETVINARSETVFEKSAFDGVRRCVVPADGWYEWTGKKGKKQAHRIRRASGEPLFFAAICDVWTSPAATELWQVATLTCEPNNDVAPIHHRMSVILEGAQIAKWLNGTQAEAASLCNSLPDGLLHIEPADDVDWNGA